MLRDAVIARQGATAPNFGFQLAVVGDCLLVAVCPYMPSATSAAKPATVPFRKTPANPADDAVDQVA